MEYLKTTFHCHECGERLSIEHEAKETIVGEGTYAEDNQVGGRNIYYNAVAVRPCQPCIEKYTAPAKKLITVLEELNINRIGEKV